MIVINKVSKEWIEVIGALSSKREKEQLINKELITRIMLLDVQPDDIVRINLSCGKPIDISYKSIVKVDGVKAKGSKHLMQLIKKLVTK